LLYYPYEVTSTKTLEIELLRLTTHPQPRVFRTLSRRGGARVVPLLPISSCMDITILVAKVLGIYLVVSGLFLVFRGKAIPHLLKDLFGHPAVIYLIGILMIFLSSMYLIQYNIWDGTWKTLITVFVWAVMIKGLLYIFAPQILSELAIRKSRSAFAAWGIVAVAAGLYLFLYV